MDADEARIARKRAQLEERRKVILDPRARRGVDLPAIQAQMEEKERRKHSEEEEELEWTRRQEAQAQLLGDHEAEMERLRFEEEARVRAYNMAQRKEDRQSSQFPTGAIDTSIPDEEAGLAAARHFEGEDPHKKERELRQTEQLRVWANEGAARRKQQEQEERLQEERFALEAAEADQKIFEYEMDMERQKQEQLRRDREYNLAQAEEKRLRERQQALEDARNEQSELQATNNSAFMTESMAKSRGQGGRVVTTEFKGMTHAEIQSIKNRQREQVEERMRLQKLEREEEERHELAQRRQQQQIDDYMSEMEHQKAQDNASHRRFLLEQAEAQKAAREQRERELSTNTPGDDYFGQFGTSAR
jgi:RIB43A-like with coiled-coils protein